MCLHQLIGFLLYFFDFLIAEALEMRDIKGAFLFRLLCPCLIDMVTQHFPCCSPNNMCRGMVLRKLLPSLHINVHFHLASFFKLRSILEHMHNHAALLENIHNFFTINRAKVMQLPARSRVCNSLIHHNIVSDNLEHFPFILCEKIIVKIQRFSILHSIERQLLFLLGGVLLLVFLVQLRNTRIEIVRNNNFLANCACFLRKKFWSNSLAVIQSEKLSFSNILIEHLLDNAFCFLLRCPILSLFHIQNAMHLFKVLVQLREYGL